MDLANSLIIKMQTKNIMLLWIFQELVNSQACFGLDLLQGSNLSIEVEDFDPLNSKVTLSVKSTVGGGWKTVTGTRSTQVNTRVLVTGTLGVLEITTRPGDWYQESLELPKIHSCMFEAFIAIFPYFLSLSTLMRICIALNGNDMSHYQSRQNQ